MEAAQAVPITERLRNIKIGSYTVDHGSHSKHIAVNAICEEAATEIERLTDEIARYRCYEHVEAENTKRKIWVGPRWRIPPGYREVSNESGVPGQLTVGMAGNACGG